MPRIGIYTHADLNQIREIMFNREDEIRDRFHNFGGNDRALLVSENQFFTNEIAAIFCGIQDLEVYYTSNGTLDKEATSHNDLFDSFRLFLQFWHV